jgi:hypothetical protein
MSFVPDQPSGCVDPVNQALRVNVVAGGGSGGPATIADGADVAQGATTDVAVTADVSGTLSGKLRGLVKIFADVWDAVNHRFKVDGSGVTQPVSGNVSVTLPDAGQDRTLRNVLEEMNATLRELTDFMYTLRDQFQYVQTPVQGTVQVANFPPPVNSVAVANLPAVQAISVGDGLQDRVIRNLLEEILITLQETRAAQVQTLPALSAAISTLEGIN